MDKIECQFSLRDLFRFNEKEFLEFKSKYGQSLIDSFMDVAITGITIAFMLRVVMLKSQNTVLDLVLPFVIFSFIAFVYYVNKVSSHVKHFFHPFVIPIVGVLSARKTMSQND